MAKNNTTVSDFYCTQCGSRGLPVVRLGGRSREPGHLKKLYCSHCGLETNHAEIRSFGDYDYEDFQIEFIHGNFSTEGLRINPHWRNFVATVKQKEGYYDEE